MRYCDSDRRQHELLLQKHIRVAVTLEADDDRASVHAGDRVMLVIEDDLAFARGQRVQWFVGVVDADQARDDFGIDFKLHIGINTGPVVAAA